MAKRKPNEEIFLDGDRAFRLVADFGFLESVNNCGKDCARLFSELSEGLMHPGDVRNIIACALSDVDGEAVKESQRKAIATDLINRYGLQECAIMARIMLSHGLIGDIKKHQADRLDRQRTLLEQFHDSKSVGLRKVLLLWAAMLTGSIIFQCMIFKIWPPLGG